jgi:Zn-dependent protease with chaperone function
MSGPRPLPRLPARALPAGGLALTAAAFVLDLPSALARLIIVSVLLGAVTRLSAATDALAVLAAFGPYARSIAALAAPLPAGPLYRGALGARKPSGREREALDAAVALLPGVAPLRSTLVVDSPEENAWVLGSTLFVSRGLFESPHLTAVVAHEAGHLAGGDGRIALAAWWLPVRPLARLGIRLLGADPQPGAQVGDPAGRTLPQPHIAGVASGTRAGGPGRPRGLLRSLLRLPAIVAGACLLLVAGGLFPSLLRPLWARHRRAREYAADAFAARAGQGPALIEALADWQMLDVATPWWQGRAHPHIEERIDHLQRFG